MQNGNDAIRDLFAGRLAERVPHTDSPWGDTLRKWVGQGMPADDKGNPVNPATHFGFDMRGCGGWINWHPNTGPGEVLEETDEWRITRNGSGAALKYWKKKSGTPEHIDFLMTDRQIWDRDYRPLLLSVEPNRRIGDPAAARRGIETARAEGKWAFLGSQFIWENMRASMGDYTMYTSLLTDPAWIHDYCRVYTDLYKACYALLFAEAGVPDGVWIYEDLGYRDRLFCNPAVLEELIFPYYTELVAFYHSYGIPVIFHSCGYQEPAIPLMIQAGFDGLHPMEVKAGNDILAFAERFGDRLVFVGGLDARILESGDRARIRGGVADHINGLRARGARFVYGSDHSISTNVDYADYLYSLEVYRDLMANG